MKNKNKSNSYIDHEGRSSVGARVFLLDIESDGDVFVGFGWKRHVDQCEQRKESNLMKDKANSVDAIETVVVVRMKEMISMGIQRTRSMSMAANHLVASDFSGITHDAFLQSSRYSKIHIVVLVSPPPVDIRIAIGSDEVVLVEGSHATK